MRLHVRSGAYEHSLMEYAICTPILCMRESSEGSGETAHMLMLVRALTDRICHIKTPILCMCESSEGSGETARMLMLVRALTDRMCHINTHFVHVREQ